MFFFSFIRLNSTNENNILCIETGVWYFPDLSALFSSEAKIMMKCHINLYQVMTICLKLTDFICEYLKVGCIESVLGVGEKETKRSQNTDREWTGGNYRS